MKENIKSETKLKRPRPNRFMLEEGEMKMISQEEFEKIMREDEEDKDQEK